MQNAAAMSCTGQADHKKSIIISVSASVCVY